jgi:hypothetical protein
MVIDISSASYHPCNFRAFVILGAVRQQHLSGFIFPTEAL